MVAIIAKRALILLVVLLGATLLVFALGRLAPMDPAEAYAHRMILNPTPEQIDDIAQKMGTNLPVWQQYFRWLGNFFRGEFGTSLLTKNPVAQDIALRLPTTMLMVGMAMGWALLIAIPVGIRSAVRKNGVFDQTTRVITIFGISIPNFWLGFLLLLFCIGVIPGFKVINTNSVGGLLLPSIAIAIPIAASIIRQLRAALLGNMNEDYVLFARARGISQQKIIYGHVLKNSLPPVVTMACQYLGSMIAGSAVIEMVFSVKGMGSYLVDAIMAQDIVSINSSVAVLAIIFVLCNLAADVINTALNPRMNVLGGRAYA